MASEFTEDDFNALPEFSIAGEFDVVTDPQTGYSERIRRPQRFLVHTEEFMTRDRQGRAWRIFTDQDGQQWKERSGW